MPKVYVHFANLAGDIDDFAVQVVANEGEIVFMVMNRIRMASNIPPAVRDRLFSDFGLSYDGEKMIQGAHLKELEENADLFAIEFPEAELYVHTGSSKKLPNDHTVLVKCRLGHTSCSHVIMEFLKDCRKDKLFSPHSFGLKQTSTSNEAMWCHSHAVLPTMPFPQDGDVFICDDHDADNNAKKSLLEVQRVASDYVSSGKFAAAVAYCREKRELLDAELSSSLGIDISIIMAGLYRKAKLYLEAAEELHTVVAANIRLSRIKENVAVLEILGDVLVEGGHYDEAGRAYTETIYTMIESKTVEEEMSPGTKEQRIKLGGAIYMAGEKQRAVGIVQEALQGDTTHDFGVMWMSRFYLDRGLKREALMWALQIMIRRSNIDKGSNTKWKDNFVYILKAIGMEGIDLLHTQILGSPNMQKHHGEYYAYICHTCRDYGLMEFSQKFAKLSQEGESNNSQYMLNAVHVLENVGRHAEALLLGVQFLEKIGNVNIGDTKCTASEVAQMLQDLEIEPTETFPPPVDALKKRITKERLCLRSDGREHMRIFKTADECKDIETGKIFIDPTKKKDGQCEYSADALNILGLVMTTVRNLFLVGFLDRIPPIAAAMGDAVVDKFLHNSLIMNEASYFTVVSLLMQHLDYRPDQASRIHEIDTEKNVLYIMGDSHSLSLAHHTMKIDNCPTLLVNSLVTGLKIWHLRDESTFYPKRNYEAVLAGIPHGADVLFIFGEIDCREGLQRATDRGVYSSLDEAMKKVGKIYVQRLLELRKTDRFGKIFVHLPPPSIVATAKVVKSFQKVLKALFEPHAHQFTVLDVPITSADGKLHPEFHFDATHVSPKYIPTLEKCVSDAALCGLMATQRNSSSLTVEDIETKTPDPLAKLGIVDVALRVVQRYCSTRLYGKAIQHCRNTISKIEDVHGETCDEVVKLRRTLADILFTAQLYEKASVELSWLAQNVKAPQDVRVNILDKLGQALHKQEHFMEASAAFQEAITLVSAHPLAVDAKHVTDIQLRLGGALFMMDQEAHAINIVQGALKGDTSNDLGLLWMSRFYLKRNKKREALQWALELLRRNEQLPPFNDYKENFAHIVNTLGNKDSMNVVINEVLNIRQKKDEPVFLNFMASAARDYGNLEFALACHERRHRTDPSDPHKALMYAHAFEHMGKQGQSLRVIANYLKQGNVSKQQVVKTGTTCGEFAAMMGDMPQKDEQFPTPVAVLQKRLTAPRKYLRTNEKEDVFIFDRSEDCEGWKKGGCELLPPTKHGEARSKCPHSEDDLQFLGLIMAAVKNMFVIGMIDRIPPIAKALFPACTDAKLDTTSISNESSYFWLATFLLQYRDPNLEVTKQMGTAKNYLYVIGDSHSLSPSYHTIKIKGRETLLVNSLVTGLKLWHLRDDSTFYPKRNYERVIAGIPRGADVIFTFGEIDCREGVQKATDKGMYPTLDDAMHYIARIYLKRLQEVRKGDRFGRIFVHLPPPSLKPTVATVLAFQKILKEVFQPHEHQFIIVEPEVADAILLMPKPEYSLDAVHLNPTYLKLVEEIINEKLA